MKRAYLLGSQTLMVFFLLISTVSASPHAVESKRNSQKIDGHLTGSPQHGDLLPQSTEAISRVEDSDVAIIYTGSWSPVIDLLFSGHASHSDFTESSTPGDSATFDFIGTWIHLGFITDRFGGEVDILIDGVSQGMMDLYTRDSNVASFVFDGLADISHTLTIVVAGTSHANSSGVEVKLDYIDTWDGTLMPDGTYEESDPRIWTSSDWDFLSDPSASGGGYAQTSFQGDNTAWFPFTGDTLTYHAMATDEGGVGLLLIDGEPLATLNLYSTTTVTDTFSFENLGSGPHVLTIRHFLGGITLDALSTPGVPPYYQAPAYSGIVRYEEYDPALKYNGYDLRQRPQSWGLESVSQVSGGAVLGSGAADDTISLTFDGQWVNLGFRTRNKGGQAEVMIDGVSHGTIGAYSASEGVKSYQFGGLPEGSHTLTITVLGQPDPPGSDSYIYLDYIDVWDGSQMPDDNVNVLRSEPSGRLHFSNNVIDISHPDAYQEDFAGGSLPNANNNIWYSFTGDSFTFLAFSHPSNSSVEVYLDETLIDTPDPIYPFSQTPLAFHYTGFNDGPHVVRVHNVWNIQVDAFKSNPSFLGPYKPTAEWWESERTAGGSIWGGIHVPIAAGDVTGDGNIELVVASSNIDSNGELFLMRGDGSDAGSGSPIIWSIPYNLPDGFEDVAAPAIAELDGQPGAEIVHLTVDGMYVYHSNGSNYWMTDTLRSHAFFSTPSIGNLDSDPEPEIVVNLDDSLAVLEHDGNLAWKITLANTPGMPMLADLTGDGSLDILFHDTGSTLYLYEYNLGNPTLTWTTTFTTSLQIYGSAAIADIDGQQPGGDSGPEIAIASDGWLHVLDADKSPVWSTELDSGRSGGVAIGDLDGDGEIELVTTMEADGGQIYALNADGTLLWSIPALDNSPLSVSLVDLEGDGTYEVAWNGANQGLTLFNGLDGSVLFNDGHNGVISQTGSDYPVFADVDLDGYGELVVAAHNGVRVFGFDGYWGPARSLWNQHTYHITNINDDLSIPIDEPNSWEEYNNYRAQFTPEQAQRDVSLIAQGGSLSGEPGETVVHVLELSNTGNRTDTFSLGYMGNVWDVHLPVNQETLAAGESIYVSVEVTIPADATDGQTDVVTITATSHADPAVADSIELTTTTTADTSSDFQLYLPVITN